MSTEEGSEENLQEEFNTLGKNFLKAIQGAWDRPERKRIENEIASGLESLSSSIKKEAENFSDSPAGHKMKSDIDELGKKIKAKDAHKRIRKELLNILKNTNLEIEKAIEKISDEESEKSE